MNQMEQGEKLTIILGGREVPGIAIGSPRDTRLSVTSRDPARNGATVSVPATMQRVISLRETNPANGPVRSYLTITEENLRFTFPRLDSVIGLDATEDGEVIPLAALVEQAKADLKAHQERRLVAASTPAEVELDLDDETLAAMAAAEQPDGDSATA